jgi:hypothetical protein
MSIAQASFVFSSVGIAMATGFDKTRRVLDAIVHQHIEKCQLNEASRIRIRDTFFNVAFLGKLVQLARPSLEVRLLSGHFARLVAAATLPSTISLMRENPDEHIIPIRLRRQ